LAQNRSVKFCVTCGEALHQQCPEGHLSAASARFCKVCGVVLASDDVTAVVGAVGPQTPVTKQSPWTGSPKGDATSGPPDAANSGAFTPSPSAAFGADTRPMVGRRGPDPWVIALICVVLVVGVVVVVVVLTSKGSKAKVRSTATSTTTTTTASSSQTTQTSGPPQTITPTSAPSEQAAAKSLTKLLFDSVVDRSAIVNATSAAQGCNTLPNDVTVFNTAASSRQSLISQLSMLPGASTLPTEMGQALTAAWTASLTVDRDYAEWASTLESNGCTVSSSTSNQYFTDATTPNNQATANKKSFAFIWNSLPSQYGLTQYQWYEL
jgi:hypothetical protein